MVTYTTPLGFNKQARNENYNSWDTLEVLNFDLIAKAIAGTTSIALSGGNYTLTDNDGAADESRSICYIISSSDAARSVIIPTEAKGCFVVDNRSSYVILVKLSASTGASVMPGTKAVMYTDGSEVYRVGVSGWGMLSSTATTSGANVTVDTRATGQAFKDCMIVFNAVSIDTTGNLVISLTGATGSFTATGVFSSAAGTYSGSLELLNCRANAGQGLLGLGINTNDVAVCSYSGSLPNFKWNLSGGITTVLLDPSGNWDAGAVEVWLK